MSSLLADHGGMAGAAGASHFSNILPQWGLHRRNDSDYRCIMKMRLRGSAGQFPLSFDSRAENILPNANAFLRLKLSGCFRPVEPQLSGAGEATVSAGWHVLRSRREVHAETDHPDGLPDARRNQECLVMRIQDKKANTEEITA